MKAFMNLILAYGLPAIFSRFENLIPRLESLLQPALVVFVTFASILAVYLGVKLATADDQNKRQQAKKHVVTFIVAMVMVVVLIFLCRAIINFAQSQI